MVDLVPLLSVIGICCTTVLILYLLSVCMKHFPPNSTDQRLSARNAHSFMPGLRREDVEDLLLDAARWECSICSFQNLMEKTTCSLCHSPKGYYLIEHGTALSNRSGSSSRVRKTSSSIRRITSQLVTTVFDNMVLPEDLNPCQRSARMRKQWTRLSTGSSVQWFRHFTNATQAPQAFVIQLNYSSACSIMFHSLPTVIESPQPTTEYSPIMTPHADSPKFSHPIAWVPIEEHDHMTVVGTDLNDGMWSALVELSKLPFSMKYAWFLHQLSDLLTPYNVLHVNMKVKRDSLLQEALENMSRIEPRAYCATIRFEFDGEAARDAGAVQREWYLLVAQALLHEDCGLFVESNREDHSYFINPNALSHHIIMDYIQAYRAVGRFIGRALLDGQMLPFHLSPVLLKAILGVPLSLDDIEHLDPLVYKSLQYILNHAHTDELSLTFSVTEQLGPQRVEEVDLIQDGHAIAVNDDNKHEYVQRMVKYLLYDRIECQLQSMLEGIYDIVPPELLLVFDHKEFELILCGLTEIDVDDWEKNSIVSSNLKGHTVTTWFWELVRAMNQAEKAKLLQYSTGSSRVPVQGFKGLTSYDGKICYFTLKGVPYTTGRYPSIHACYNRIDLPIYPTKELLQEALSMVLLSDPTGFTIE